MCFVLSAMIYPLVVHWVWNKQGFLNQLGFLDFAGSAAIHAVGGICGLVATIMMGPRIGRFDSNGNVNAIPGHNIAYQVSDCDTVNFNILLCLCYLIKSR